MTDVIDLDKRRKSFKTLVKPDQAVMARVCDRIRDVNDTIFTSVLGYRYEIYEMVFGALLWTTKQDANTRSNVLRELQAYGIMFFDDDGNEIDLLEQVNGKDGKP